MNLKKIIESHTPFDENEELEKQSFLQFLNNFNEEEIGLRSNLIGHLTASSWVVNKSRDSVVMAYHNIYKSWAWLGGHADGDKDMLYVAKKETAEESGLSNFSVLSELPIDVAVGNVQPHIKKGKFVPAHLHFNLTYLFEADDKLPLSYRPEESSGVKWIKNKDVLSQEDNEHIKQIYDRIMKKVEKFK